GHRPKAVHRRPDRRADDHRLRERRVDHPVVAELRPQPIGRQEYAALLADVLAEHDDALVASHLLGERVADRLDERHERHYPASPASPAACPGPVPHGGGPSDGQSSAYTQSIAVDGSGSGSASAKSVAAVTRA